MSATRPYRAVQLRTRPYRAVQLRTRPAILERAAQPCSLPLSAFRCATMALTAFVSPLPAGRGHHPQITYPVCCTCLRLHTLYNQHTCVLSTPVYTSGFAITAVLRAARVWVGGREMMTPGGRMPPRPRMTLSELGDRGGGGGGGGGGECL